MRDGSADSPGLTVVVMAYNEEASLEGTAAEIHGVLERLPLTSELLIIDDGSTDGTGGIADALSGRLSRVRVIHHAANAGLGGVYRTGFAEARGDLVTFFPADGQFPADIIEDFVKASRDADLVLGYVPQRNDALAGRVLSVAQRMIYRVLVGPMPRFQGIMMYRQTLMRRTALASHGRDWVVVMEFILRASRSGARIVNRATSVRPRQFGVSKVNNWRTIRSTLVHMARLRRALRS